MTTAGDVLAAAWRAVRGAPPPPPPPPHSHFTLASSASLALLVLLFCFPPAHARVRAAVRPPILRAVAAGLPAVAAAQAAASPALTAAATAVSATVSVPFYATVLPAVMWCVDGQLGARLALLLGLALYVGNAVKDLVCAPRPLAAAAAATGAAATSRRAARAGKARILTALPGSEDVSAAEYGFPSSHVANTLVMNAYAVLYAERAGLVPTAGGWTAGARAGLVPTAGGWTAGAPAVAAVALWSVAALWVAAVAASRVYMGMHAPVDVAGGAALGALVACVWSAVDDAYAGWLAAGGVAAAAQQALLTAVALRLHPRPLAPTTSFEASTAFLGACSGVALGLARGGLAGLAPPASAAAAAARVALGLAAVAAVKAASKAAVAAVVPLPYRAVPLAVRRLWQPPVHSLAAGGRAARLGLPLAASGAPADEVLTTKFFSYAALGWAVTEAAPRLFAMVGL